MKKQKIIILSFCIIFVVFLVIPPAVGPVIHGNKTARAAIRTYIYNEGYTYQSFFAIVQDDRFDDPKFGHLYHVIWDDYKSPIGDTSPLFYVKKTKSGYKVTSVGTGP